MNENEKELSIEDIANIDFGPSILDILLDEENDENIILYDENNEAVEFEQIAVIKLREKIYALLKPANPLEGVGEDEAMVFALEVFDNGYELVLEMDEDVIDEVFDVYCSMLDEQND